MLLNIKINHAKSGIKLQNKVTFNTRIELNNLTFWNANFENRQ